MHSSASLSRTSLLACALLPFARALPQPAADDACSTTCASYGIDFHNGGSYFQNSLSSDPFTFVSQFEGCQTDVVQNFLVDPNGNEFLCSNTTTTPDDSNQLSTCPELKNQLYSGSWSIVLISNNGNCAPFSGERDIILSVGPQQTSTLPASTVSFTQTVTPVVNVTSTETVTTTYTSQRTVTSPGSGFQSTVTVNRNPTTTTTQGFATFTITTTRGTVVTVTSTKTAYCSGSTRAAAADPVARVRITLTSGVVATQAVAAIQTAAAAAVVGSRDAAGELLGDLGGFFGLGLERRVPADQEERIAERKARIARRRLEKRSPDDPTVTVTPTTVDSTTSYVTAASTATRTVVVDKTSTVTTRNPNPTTTYLGVTASQKTTTISSPSVTRTFYVPWIITSTTYTQTSTATVYTTSTPPGLSASCKSSGGKVTAAIAR